MTVTTNQHSLHKTVIDSQTLPSHSGRSSTFTPKRAWHMALHVGWGQINFLRRGATFRPCGGAQGSAYKHPYDRGAPGRSVEPSPADRAVIFSSISAHITEVVQSIERYVSVHAAGTSRQQQSPDGPAPGRCPTVTGRTARHTATPLAAPGRPRVGASGGTEPRMQGCLLLLSPPGAIRGTHGPCCFCRLLPARPMRSSSSVSVRSSPG